MPWKAKDTMSLRREFVELAVRPGANIRQLCRRFSISPATGYKWLARWSEHGETGLIDRSRRPHTCPTRTEPALEEAILAIRKKSHNEWGGRKINRRLKDLGWSGPPAPSTITEVMRRHGRLNRALAQPKALGRFERPAPNDLWQMDFKGHFAMRTGRCHPLGLIDDHSRYNLGLFACGNERAVTVRPRLEEIFSRYGLPWEMLMDNGSCWGVDGQNRHTQLTVWLIRLGIRVIHGRPYHPQTQGKQERFHGTLQRELLAHEKFLSLAHCQERFDQWRQVYNCQRPHESLDLDVPVRHYQPSSRQYPDHLPAIEYAPGDIVRKVGSNGRIVYQSRRYRICQAFRGQSVALRPSGLDGLLDVFFCSQKIARIDLRTEES